MTDRTFYSNRASQQGVVLFMSLVMLLLLTALGASSIQTTSVQFQMSQSVDDINLAFQSAEAALRDGEQTIEYGGASPITISDEDGVYTALEWLTLDWTDDSLTTAGTTQVEGVSEPGRYVIEFIREVKSETDALNLTNIGEEIAAGGVTVFRVTARGTGFGTGRGIVMVQSTYGKVW